MAKTVLGTYLRYDLRTAAKEHPCFGWLEKTGYQVYGVNCTRIIGVGEKHLITTIYPGHDSGLADGWQESLPKWNPVTCKFDRVVWIDHKPAPIARRFCLPCAHDWRDMKAALEQMGELNQELIR